MLILQNFYYKSIAQLYLRETTRLTVKIGPFFEISVCVLRNNEKTVWNANLLLEQTWAPKLP